MSNRKTPSDSILKKLYLDKKMSSGQIAKKYKLSRVTICRHLKRLGIVRPQSGENSRNRNYNIKVYRSGYPVTFKPNHSRRNNLGYVFDHILEWEKKWKYVPKRSEPIHHIDLDRKNSNVKNLYLCKGNSEHQKLHASLNKIINKLVNKGVIKFKNGEYYL